MKIVGCDLHARQQTIAMVDTETGEFTEKAILPRRECSTRVLRGSGRSSGGGHRSHRIDAMVLGTAGGVGDRVPGGSSSKDPRERDAEAETRSTGRTLDVGSAHRESLSGDLDAVDRSKTAPSCKVPRRALCRALFSKPAVSN